MILKVVKKIETKNHGEYKTEIIDNISKVDRYDTYISFFNEKTNDLPIYAFRINKDNIDQDTTELVTEAYLMNNIGQTIERLI